MNDYENITMNFWKFHANSVLNYVAWKTKEDLSCLCFNSKAVQLGSE